MSNQSENIENKAEKSSTRFGLKGWIILIVISSIMAFFTYDSDDRTLSYDNALKCMMLSKEAVHNQLNRDGAVITQFPRDWDSWNFDHEHIRTYERSGNKLADYVLKYQVPFLLAGHKLETDVILNVVHNETIDKWSIRKVSVPQFNQYIGQLGQLRRR